MTFFVLAVSRTFLLFTRAQPTHIAQPHRYQLGLAKGVACPWLPPSETVTRHADAPYPEVTGQTIPFMQEALKIVTE